MHFVFCIISLFYSIKRFKRFGFVFFVRSLSFALNLFSPSCTQSTRDTHLHFYSIHFIVFHQRAAFTQSQSQDRPTGPHTDSDSDCDARDADADADADWQSALGCLYSLVLTFRGGHSFLFGSSCRVFAAGCCWRRSRRVLFVIVRAFQPKSPPHRLPNKSVSRATRTSLHR